MRRFMFAPGLALAVSLWAATIACAAEIKVLTAGAFKPVLLSEIPAFERQTGNTVVVQNDTAGALLKRVKSGEAFDLVVLTQGALQELGASGEVAAASIAPLAKVGIGVAMKAGAAAPDISSTQGFRHALLSARAVAWMDPAAGGTSGIYLAQLFARLGIADEMKRKAVLVPGGLSAERLLSGEAELAIQQMSELAVVPGAAIIGPLPADLQNYTVYAGAISARAAQAAAAAQLLEALQRPALRAGLAARGMQAP